MLGVNLNAVIEGTQLGLRYFNEQKNKSVPHTENQIIINTASLGGFVPVRRFPIYSASKFGIVGFTKAVGEKTFSDHGVRVVSMAPSLVKTPMSLAAMKKDPGNIHIFTMTQIT